MKNISIIQVIIFIFLSTLISVDFSRLKKKLLRIVKQLKIKIKKNRN